MTDEAEKPGARPATLAAAMEEVVAALDPVTRDIFLLHRQHDWSYTRIARERGISVAEVERHVAQAIATLDLGLRQRGL